MFQPSNPKNLALQLAVGQKRYPKWNPGKWKHGLKPAVRFLNFDAPKLIAEPETSSKRWAPEVLRSPIANRTKRTQKHVPRTLKIGKCPQKHAANIELQRVIKRCEPFQNSKDPLARCLLNQRNPFLPAKTRMPQMLQPKCDASRA